MNSSEDSEDRSVRPRFDSFSSSSSSYGSLRLSARGASFQARPRRKRPVASSPAGSRKPRVGSGLTRAVSAVASGTSSLSPPPHGLSAEELPQSGLPSHSTSGDAKSIKRKKSDKIKVDSVKSGDTPVRSPSASPNSAPKFAKPKKKLPTVGSKDINISRSSKFRPLESTESTASVASTKPKLAATKKKRATKDSISYVVTPPGLEAPIPEPLPSFAAAVSSSPPLSSASPLSESTLVSTTESPLDPAKKVSSPVKSTTKAPKKTISKPIASSHSPAMGEQRPAETGPKKAAGSPNPTSPIVAPGPSPVKKTVLKRRKPVPQKNFLHHLPLELLINTLLYLDALSLTRVGQCSKMLHQIGSENILWRDICMRPGFLKAGQKKPKSMSWSNYFRTIFKFRHSTRFFTCMHDTIPLIIGQTPTAMFELQAQLSHSPHGLILTGLHNGTKEYTCLCRAEFEEPMVALFKEHHLLLRQLENADSPHLVPQYGIFFDGSSIWHLSEYCDGGSARMQIDQGGGLFTEHEVAAICFSLLSALQFYHSRSKAHGAISASSIMFCSYDKHRCSVKLRDKTFSSLVSEWRLGPVASQSRRMYWRAPESQRSPFMDIWSLGITCLELVEGRPPHWNLPPAKARQQVINQPPPGLLHPNRWSDNFRRFLEACLSKDPLRRPTAATLLQHPFLRQNIQTFSDRLLYRQIAKIPKSETPLVLPPIGPEEPAPAPPFAPGLPAGALQRSTSMSSSLTTFYSDEEENISFASLSHSHVSLADSYSDDFTDHSYNSLSHSTDFY